MVFNKKSIEIRYALLFVMLLSGSLFMGCDTEEEPGVPPQAGFIVNTDESYNSLPTTVKFVNTSTNADTYFWDYGNGETSTFKDGVATYFEKGVYTIMLVASNAWGSDTVRQDIEVFDWGMEEADITGRWHMSYLSYITEQEDTTTLTYASTYPETFLFNEDGTYMRISPSWVEWESGTYEVLSDSLVFHPQDGSDEFEDHYAIIDKLVVGSSAYMEVSITMEEAGERLTIVAKLWKVDPDPAIDFSGKWSVYSISGYRYSLISDMIGFWGDSTYYRGSSTSADLPSLIAHNYYTLNFLDNDSIQVINNWETGMSFMVYARQLDEYNYWITAPDRNLLMSTSGPYNGALTLRLYYFANDDNGTTWRYAEQMSLNGNDGTEAGIAATDLAGSWEITSKKEQKNYTLLPADEHGPALGTIVTFSDPVEVNGYATGTVGPWEYNLTVDWLQLDASNLTIFQPSSGDQRLYHVDSYDAAAGTLYLYSLWNDTDGNRYEMYLTLQKQ